MRDYIFKRLLFLCSLLVLLICGGMVYSLVSGAVPAFEKFGFFHFISSVEWDPGPVMSNMAPWHSSREPL